MTIFLNTYMKGSKGAFNLKAALVARGSRVFITNRAPKHNTPLVVSWGNSEWEYDPEPYRHVINPPVQLYHMSNKLRFFQRTGHSEMVPEWTTEPREAEKWERKVFVRHKLEGSGGAGIEVIDRREEQGITLPKAPLYVKHYPKTHEFRVHTARGLRSKEFYPLLIQQKVFQKTEDNPAPKDWNVRNHANGFVFVRQGTIPIPKEVEALSIAFMAKHFPMLHFAALDILYHQKHQRAVVLEGNTAPGLEGNTVEVYADYVKSLEKEAYRV